MFDVGIIGGMGPAATAELFRRIVLYTSAQTDQQHLKLCILNDPTVPDRTEFILHGGDSPLPLIRENIHTAKKFGCERFAIPCNTSHYFYQEFERVEGITFINMVRETCRYVAQAHKGKSVCVLATLGTVQGDVYNTAGKPVDAVHYPCDETNRRLMDMIRKIKAGACDFATMAAEVERLLCAEFSVDSTVFILACTELSMLVPYLHLEAVDAMDVLAGKLIADCGKELNEQYFPLKKSCFQRDAYAEN